MLAVPFTGKFRHSVITSLCHEWRVRQQPLACCTRSSANEDDRPQQLVEIRVPSINACCRAARSYPVLADHDAPLYASRLLHRLSPLSTPLARYPHNTFMHQQHLHVKPKTHSSTSHVHASPSVTNPNTFSFLKSGLAPNIKTSNISINLATRHCPLSLF